MSAADCGCVMSATPCPAHIESASMSTGSSGHRRRRLVTDDRFAGGEVRDHVALAWPLVVRGAARGVPRLGR